METSNRNNYPSTYDWIKQFEKLPFYGWYQGQERGVSTWSTSNGTKINQAPNDNHIFIGLLDGYKRRTIKYN